MRTKQQIETRLEQIAAFPSDSTERAESMKALRADLRLAGWSNTESWPREEWFSRIGVIAIRNLGSCGTHISFAPAATVRAAAAKRAQRDRIRSTVDA